MHPKAKEWDERNPKKLPRNRPCDWCGLPVKSGYIHKKCLKKEEKLYREIALD